MNKMWHNENNLVFPFTAPLSLPIYCLILPSSSLPHTAVDCLPPPPPSYPPALISFGGQLIPKKGRGLETYKQILRNAEGKKEWVERVRERWGVGLGLGVVSLTLFNILRTAGESGVYRIFPISRGLTEFHTIFVTGLDSRVCIRSLQNGAIGRKIAKTVK